MKSFIELAGAAVKFHKTGQLFSCTTCQYLLKMVTILFVTMEIGDLAEKSSTIFIQ